MCFISEEKHSRPLAIYELESYSSEKFVQENLLTDIQIEKSKVLSSPIIITRSHKVSGNEVGQLVESLPNLRSHTENLDAHGVHCPLSHSLDSRSKSLKSKMWSKDYSSYISSDQDQQLAGEQSTNENALLCALGEINLFTQG